MPLYFQGISIAYNRKVEDVFNCLQSQDRNRYHLTFQTKDNIMELNG